MTHSASARIQLWELLTVFAIVVVAFGTRFAYSNRLAVEHFDEGVYASNVWFGEKQERAYPEQHLYAPPLLPLLIECSFLISGPSNQWAMLPEQIAGACTPMFLWWIGRQWFGAVGGCVAGLLCALSDVHILLSRSALTDVLLGLWWLLALAALRTSCTSGRFTSSIIAGCFVGLAWWTKYNGWMPLALALTAIVARALLLYRLRDSRLWQVTRTALWGWSLSAATAFLFWLPWLFALQSRGGYGAVLVNHRRYVVGLAGWWSSAARQISQLHGISGPATTLSILSLTALVIWLSGRQWRPQADSANPKSLGAFATAFEHPLLILLLILAAFWPVLGIAGLASVAIIRWSLTLGSQVDGFENPSRVDLTGWLMGVWFVGMSLSTPLYHPYLRLTVPWVLASYLGAGWAWHLVCLPRCSDLVLDGNDAARSPRHANRSWRIVLPLGLLASTIWSGSNILSELRSTNPTACFADRGDLKTIAKAIREISEPKVGPRSHENQAAGIYVFAEPALLFQLRLAGLGYVAPAGSLKFVESHPANSPSRVFLAVGIHARQDPQFQEQFAKWESRLKPRGTWPWHLSPLVSLDQPDSRPELIGRDPVERSEIELFEVVSE